MNSTSAEVATQGSEITVTAPLADQIRQWSAALDVMQAEQRALIAAGRWLTGPADVLGVIGWDRWELAHSAAVAWLLDPRMRHGLGSRLLGKLLMRCFADDPLPDLGTAWCETEVPRGGSRIDILAHADGLTLVIENKVDALENSDQCETYFDYFHDDPGARFIFLTPTGDAPTTARSEAANAAWRALSYRDLLDDLKSVLAGTGRVVEQIVRLFTDSRSEIPLHQQCGGNGPHVFVAVDQDRTLGLRRCRDQGIDQR